MLEEPSQLGRLQCSFHKRPLQDVVSQTLQTVVLPWYFFCAQRAISFANNTCLICDLVFKFRSGRIVFFCRPRPIQVVNSDGTLRVVHSR